MWSTPPAGCLKLAKAWAPRWSSAMMLWRRPGCPVKMRCDLLAGPKRCKSAAARSRLPFGGESWTQPSSLRISRMRMSDEDARTRRDHYRRSGSATEYDALHGPGLYRRGGGLFRLLGQALLWVCALQPHEHVIPKRKQGTPLSW